MLAASNGCCNGWLMLHSVDLERAVERNMDFFHERNKRSRSSYRSFEPIDMGIGGDDKVLLHKDGKQIVLYDLKRDVFELFTMRDKIPEWVFCFRYTPTTMFISKSKTF